jgi:hypothetical protein
MDPLALAALILERPLLFFLIAFASIFGSFLLGRAIGRYRTGREGSASLGLLDGAVIALIGLLLAFTFSSAAARFEQRRALIVEEANAIGTAKLRIDLMPADAQPAMRALFDRYIEGRVASYKLLSSPEAFRAAYAETQALQAEIWTAAIAATGRPDMEPPLAATLLTSLNTMFDITTTRTAALMMHTPAAVHLVLWLATLIGATVAGFASCPEKRVAWASILGFSALLALILYMIVDFEYPRAGLIRVDNFDQLLLTGSL